MKSVLALPALRLAAALRASAPPGPIDDFITSEMPGSRNIWREANYWQG
jgi:hypothetical protein